MGSIVPAGSDFGRFVTEVLNEKPRRRRSFSLYMVDARYLRLETIRQILDDLEAHHHRAPDAEGEYAVVMLRRYRDERDAGPSWTFG
jgi:hypothetical protein